MNRVPKIYLKVEDAANINETLEKAKQIGYDGIITSTVNSEYRRELVDKNQSKNQRCFTRSPLILHPIKWSEEVIPYIKPPNLSANDDEIKLNNELILEQEIDFAFHLKINGCIMISLSENEPEVLGKYLKAFLKKFASVYKRTLLIELPMVNMNKYLEVRGEIKTKKKMKKEHNQWNIWQRFYAATGFHRQIQLALVLTQNLPPNEELKRWLGEQIGMLMVSTHCSYNSWEYFTCKFPSSMSKQHKTVAAMFMQQARCITAIEPHGDKIPDVGDSLKCMNMIESNNIEFNISSGYEDKLFYPLQPLHDNLDTTTYETFESDPSKYILYQRAIEAALIDKVPESEIETKRLVLMVLGAGRGPLVRAALNASKNTKRKLKILVVEKNPNAIVTLTNLIEVLWPLEDIQLISSDMRTLVLEERADILVSELLGSFGDNELSPECLDGAQNLLKIDGISIPSDSKSYLRPVMTQKIHNQLRRTNASSNSLYANPKDVNWLIYLSSVYYIDEPKELFEFVHPNKSKVIDNSRHKQLKFKAKLDCLLHGFAGYFTSTLYKDINISIHPESHTAGMVSWYPIYFSIAKPVFVKAEETITVDIWRKVELEKKVWYEWQTQDSPVQNREGETHPIFL